MDDNKENKGVPTDKGENGTARRRPPIRGARGNRSYPNRYRGRGRYDPHVAKAMNLFGVKDLRDVLNQKHQEEAAKEKQTAASASANEGAAASTPALSEEEYRRGGHFNRGSHTGAKLKYSNDSDRTPRPVYRSTVPNITVRLSASSGERSCVLKENKPIQNFKHFPVTNEEPTRDRNKGAEGREKTAQENFRFRLGGEEIKIRTRGAPARAQRSRGRPRGRSGISRGRGRGSVTSTPAALNTEAKEKKDQDDGEVNEGDQGETPTEPDGATASEGDNINTNVDLTPNASNLNANETLIITASAHGESKKRTVRFNLEGDENSPEEAERNAE